MFDALSARVTKLEELVERLRDRIEPDPAHDVYSGDPEPDHAANRAAVKAQVGATGRRVSS
jgi:hypothetical protein